MPQIQLQPQVCPICASSSEGTIFAEASVDEKGLSDFAFASRKLPEYMHWRLVHCKRCDLLYSDPAPAPEQLESLYREAAFDSREEARLASRTYAQFLPQIVSQLPDRDGSLDIGTGDGAFLKELLAA